MPRIKPLRITVSIEDAEVSWSDILAAVNVVPDTNMPGAPWDNDEGWTHTAKRTNDKHGSNRQHSICYVGRIRREGSSYIWLVIDPDEMGLPDWQYFHSRGASKQVARELAAVHLHRAYDQLHTWYTNGWEYWGVTADLHGCHASVWGIDDYNYARDEMRGEIADELASELKDAGYVIIGRPTPEHEKHSAAYNSYVNNPHGVNLHNVSRR